MKIFVSTNLKIQYSNKISIIFGVAILVHLLHLLFLGYWPISNFWKAQQKSQAISPSRVNG
jgi:hypothetical protein